MKTHLQSDKRSPYRYPIIGMTTRFHITVNSVELEYCGLIFQINFNTFLLKPPTHFAQFFARSLICLAFPVPGFFGVEGCPTVRWFTGMMRNW